MQKEIPLIIITRGFIRCQRSKPKSIIQTVVGYFLHCLVLSQYISELWKGLYLLFSNLNIIF